MRMTKTQKINQANKVCTDLWEVLDQTRERERQARSQGLTIIADGYAQQAAGIVEILRDAQRGVPFGR